MKPNDKAIEAALNAFYMTRAEAEHEPNIVCMRRAVNAAYAAQFQSEEYAGLVKELRDGIIEHRRRWSGDTHDDLGGTVDYEKTEAMTNRAADALEAVLAERDRLKAELVDYKDAAASEADFVNEQGEKIKELKAERDALAARLAPVDDEKLVEIAVKEVEKVIASANDSETVGGARWKALRAARAAIEGVTEPEFSS